MIDLHEINCNFVYIPDPDSCNAWEEAVDTAHKSLDPLSEVDNSFHDDNYQQRRYGTMDIFQILGMNHSRSQSAIVRAE